MSSARTATLVLIAATILAYVNSFGTAFQFDDRATILQDSRLSSVSAFAGQASQMIRPVWKLSLLVDRQLYGQNPAGYHLLNLLLHCGSGLLLFAILTRAAAALEKWPRNPFGVNHQTVSTQAALEVESTVVDPERISGPLLNHRQSVGNSAVPFFTTLLFLLHPLATETVTYISGRPTGMAAFFLLLSLYLFLRATESRFVVCYGGALLSFVFALLSKETAIILPGLLLLWHAVFRPAPLRIRALYLHAPFWAVLCLGLIAAAFHPRYSFLAGASLKTRPVYTNLLTQINAVCHGLTLFFFPTRLNFDHDLPVFSSLAQWPLLLCLALLAGMFAAALWSLRRRPFLAFGILWFFVCLLPTNSFIPRYDILSERNLYLPSIGIFLAVVSLWDALISKSASARPALAPSLLRVICVVLAAGLLIATVSRNRVYSDQVTFWSDAVRKSPQKARTHNNLGYALYEAGDLDRALVELRTAVSLDPGSTSARENLRRVWKIKHSGDFE